MKFVDFGFANTITHLIDNLQPSINLYEGILLRSQNPDVTLLI